MSLFHEAFAKVKTLLLRRRVAIVYAIDKNYVVPLTVSLRSLLENSQSAPIKDIYILHAGLEDNHKAPVRESLKDLTGFKLNWIQADDARFRRLATGVAHVNHSMYLRLLAPALLPESVNAALYLDADTVVRDDISKLFALFDPAWKMQACRDTGGWFGSKLFQLPDLSRFRIGPEAPYFNSGVLLLNLKKWRQEKITGKVLAFAEENPDCLFLGDQNSLNIVLFGSIGELPSEWNTQAVHPKLLDKSWDIPYLPQPAPERARIYHYTSEFKPWNTGANLPAARFFHEIHARTQWANKRHAIVFGVDKNYVMPLTVCLRSLLEKSAGNSIKEIYILHSAIEQSQKRVLDDSLKDLRGFELNWVPVDEENFRSLTPGLPHLSLAAGFRFLAPSVLPPHVQVAAYLDCDTVIREDIGGLFGLFDPAWPLQACRDYVGSFDAPILQLGELGRFGIEPKAHYFNSGVLLFNVKKWREENIAKKILDFAAANPDCQFIADQNSMNIVLYKAIGELPPEWNTQAVYPKLLDGSWTFPYVPQPPPERAKIYHYTSEIKPWNTGKDLPAAAFFHDVRSRTAWAQPDPAL